MIERLPFDPDAVAIAHGEGHLIPSPLRRLTDAELRAWYPVEYAALRHETPAPVAARRSSRLVRGGVPI